MKKGFISEAETSAMPEPTPDEILAALKENGLVLKFVPKSMRTYEMCLVAVKQFGGALEFVPESMKTHDVCLEAAKQTPFAMSYAPKSVKTLEFWSALVKHGGEQVLWAVPRKVRKQVWDKENKRAISTFI